MLSFLWKSVKDAKVDGVAMLIISTKKALQYTETIYIKIACSKYKRLATYTQT